jgi:hypothetical protein
MAINNKVLKQFLNPKKGNKLLNSWLYCRWVLYALFILAIGNIYYLLMNYDYFTLAAFILVAFLTTFFSKNMVVILCISLVISTILKSVRVTEGLEEADKGEKVDKADKADRGENGEKDDKKKIGGLSKNDKESFDYILEKLSNFREGNTNDSGNQNNNNNNKNNQNNNNNNDSGNNNNNNQNNNDSGNNNNQNNNNQNNNNKNNNSSGNANNSNSNN